MLMLHTQATQEDITRNRYILGIVIHLVMSIFTPASQLIIKGKSYTAGSYQRSWNYQLPGLKLMLRTTHVSNAIL